MDLQGAFFNDIFKCCFIDQSPKTCFDWLQNFKKCMPSLKYLGSKIKRSMRVDDKRWIPADDYKFACTHTAATLRGRSCGGLKLERWNAASCADWNVYVQIWVGPGKGHDVTLSGGASKNNPGGGGRISFGRCLKGKTGSEVGVGGAHNQLKGNYKRYTYLQIMKAAWLDEAAADTKYHRRGSRR